MNTQAFDFADANRLVTGLLLNIFRPLVKILLRYHIPYSRVSETLKWVYVHEAARRHPDTSNQSAIALDTDLCRKEVKKYLVQNAPPSDSHIRRHERVPNIINGWLHDPNYSTGPGRPRELSTKSGPNSFHDLVREYGADVSASVFLKEFVGNRIVQISQNGTTVILRPEEVTRGWTLAPEQAVTKCALNVLHRWEGDRETPLPVRGEGRSVETFVREVSESIRVETVIDELKKAGAVEVQVDGHIRKLAHLYLASNRTTALQVIATDLGRLLETAAYNVSGDIPRRDGKLQQNSTYRKLGTKAQIRFHERIREEWEQLRQRLADEFEEFEDDPSSSTNVGVGIFYYEDAGEDWVSPYADTESQATKTQTQNGAIATRG